MRKWAQYTPHDLRSHPNNCLSCIRILSLVVIRLHNWLLTSGCTLQDPCGWNSNPANNGPLKQQCGSELWYKLCPLGELWAFLKLLPVGRLAVVQVTGKSLGAPNGQSSLGTCTPATGSAEACPDLFTGVAYARVACGIWWYVNCPSIVAWSINISVHAHTSIKTVLILQFCPHFLCLFKFTDIAVFKI